MISFLIHMRLHYQFFILSGGYLLGGFLIPEPDYGEYWLQFLNVHILLFGGATVFNSWWDKDEGPIGGLKNPPAMKPWMRDASLVIQFAGLAWALTTGWIFAAVYASSMLFFWLYSTPAARWKGSPVKSLVAIGISTGTNSVLLGALAGGMFPDVAVVLASVGAACIILSLYPVSQIYQIEEDRERGDLTFAGRFGVNAVKRFYTGSFIPGIGLIATSIYLDMPVVATIFAAIGGIIWFILFIWIHRLTGQKSEYSHVMKIKFAASASFVLFLTGMHLLKFFSQGSGWTDRLF